MPSDMVVITGQTLRDSPHLRQHREGMETWDLGATELGLGEKRRTGPGCLHRRLTALTTPTAPSFLPGWLSFQILLTGP